MKIFSKYLYKYDLTGPSIAILVLPQSGNNFEKEEVWVNDNTSSDILCAFYR